MLNKMTLIGHVGQEPETNLSKNDKPITRLSVATSEKWRDKESGEIHEQTEWVNCTAFGRLSDVASKYVHKGSRLFIEGKLTTRKYDDKNGITRYATTIVIRNLVLLDRKPRDAAAGAETKAVRDERQNTAADNDNFDDDVPF